MYLWIMWRVILPTVTRLTKHDHMIAEMPSTLVLLTTATTESLLIHIPLFLPEKTIHKEANELLRDRFVSLG